MRYTGPKNKTNILLDNVSIIEILVLHLLMFNNQIIETMTNSNKFQIRTNSNQFGDTLGVFLQDAENIAYGYYREAKETNEQTITDYNGNVWTRDDSHSKPRFMRNQAEGKFVKQTSFDHGTFEATQEEADTLFNSLKNNARNCWVRLYQVN